MHVVYWSPTKWITFLLLEESITNFLFDFGTCRFSDSMVLFFFNLFTSRHENSCNATYRIETHSIYIIIVKYRNLGDSNMDGSTDIWYLLVDVSDLIYSWWSFYFKFISWIIQIFEEEKSQNTLGRIDMYNGNACLNYRIKSKKIIRNRSDQTRPPINIRCRLIHPYCYPLNFGILQLLCK
jgi:hypothetical protein